MLSAPDVTILGAGVVGLSTALELHRRGARVVLVEPRRVASQASWAAAGMLAAEDPFNPPALRPLSRLSASLYPAFLRQLEEESGEGVPFQTERTVQHLHDGDTTLLQERSIDPRQLALALAATVNRLGIRVLAAKPGQARDKNFVVHAVGAWAGAHGVAPRKGQMLRVQLPREHGLHTVHRSEAVYVVPRTQGPQAGTALIGATVEDAGFETEVVPEALAGLRTLAAALVPELPGLADARQTPMVEAWAGLRPSTPDGLPLLGYLEDDAGVAGPRQVIATGHFRNGILLAPATAVLVADLIEGRPATLDLEAYSPSRFRPTGSRT